MYSNSFCLSVINSVAEDVQLEVDHVDAIVSEWMGHVLLFENMLPSVLRTRDRFLNPPPSTNITDLSAWRRERLFPCRATLYIAGFSDSPEENYDSEESGNSIDEDQWKNISELYEVNLSGAFASAVRNDKERQIHVDFMDQKCIITRSAEIATLDLATLSPDELTEHGVKGSFSMKSMGTATLRGLVIWFTVEFPDGDVLSTSPYKNPTHWQQAQLYISEPLSLVQDDVLSGEIHFTHPTGAPRDLAIDVDFVMNNAEETRVKRTYSLSS
ncbi:unnamed protein product [Rodentolepis nana]|uniref:Protein arginine N-methyltransferase 6 n=1 Tax=Rodentolepis nana TaxID=102285 RepID=A0A3P7S0C7_RODNA|nr:unnamed protein product [Rodentolepis nana]